MRETERRSQKRARVLRRDMTDAERILWSRIRPSVAQGLRFRRQHPVGPFIVDFACPLSRLAIEVDGETHGTDEEIAYDKRREAYLRSRGWHVLRFTNQEIYKSLNAVLDGIWRWSPSVSPLRGEPPPP